MIRHGINLGESESIIILLKWMKTKDWKPGIRMRPAQFLQTDRGLQVLQNVRKDSIIVSIPIECCVTRYFVSQGFIGQVLKLHLQDFSTQTLLAAWLALNQEDGWKPYLHSLPQDYSLPLFYSESEIEALPPYIKTTVDKQTAALTDSFSALLPFFPSLQFQRYSWGFATVNTRAVFLKKDPRDDGEGEEGDDALALVPFLDLLNHSDDVSVEAGINLDQSNSRKEFFYEIRLLESVARYKEAFICYGKHSNTKLLAEYGFFLGSKNKNEHISIAAQDLVAFLQHNRTKITQIEKKLSLMRENRLHLHLGISETGLNWSLKAAFFILLLEAENLKHWHNVYQHDDFQHLNVVFKDFIQYTLETLCGHLKNMKALGQPTKYFHIGVQLVEFHVDLVQRVLNESSPTI